MDEAQDIASREHLSLTLALFSRRIIEALRGNSPRSGKRAPTKERALPVAIESLRAATGAHHPTRYRHSGESRGMIKYGPLTAVPR